MSRSSGTLGDCVEGAGIRITLSLSTWFHTTNPTHLVNRNLSRLTDIQGNKHACNREPGATLRKPNLPRTLLPNVKSFPPSRRRPREPWCRFEPGSVSSHSIPREGMGIGRVEVRTSSGWEAVRVPSTFTIWCDRPLKLGDCHPVRVEGEDARIP